MNNNNSNQDFPRLSEVNQQNNQPVPPAQGYNSSNNANMYSNSNQNPYSNNNANMYSNPNPGEVEYNQNPQNDIEKGSDSYNLMGDGVNVDDMMRLGFIRKVYGILSLQLSITVALTALTFLDPVKNFLITNVWLFWTCLGLSIFIIIPLICCRSVAQKVPVKLHSPNYIDSMRICNGCYMLLILRPSSCNNSRCSNRSGNNFSYYIRLYYQNRLYPFRRITLRRNMPFDLLWYFLFCIWKSSSYILLRIRCLGLLNIPDF